MAIATKVNGASIALGSAPETPLLYVLNNELGLKGPRFGCGVAQCGSCSILIDGTEMRSCVTPAAFAEGKEITTLEGLPQLHARTRKLAVQPVYTPLQQAVIDGQSLQCGYCYNGMVVKATELLMRNPKPSDQDIRTAMSGHLCRCGTYSRMVLAIKQAAKSMEAS